MNQGLIYTDTPEGQLVIAVGEKATYRRTSIDRPGRTSWGEIVDKPISPGGCSGGRRRSADCDHRPGNAKMCRQAPRGQPSGGRPLRAKDTPHRPTNRPINVRARRDPQCCSLFLSRLSAHFPVSIPIHMRTYMDSFWVNIGRIWLVSLCAYVCKAIVHQLISDGTYRTGALTYLLCIGKDRRVPVLLNRKAPLKSRNSSTGDREESGEAQTLAMKAEREK